MLTPVRTTIAFQPSLFERLKVFSQEQGKTLSEVVQLGVRQIIEQHERTKVDALYHELFMLRGMVKEPITDASSNIDDLLYGNGDDWKGQRA